MHAQWSPDNGDGTYKNPIIHADYSDPDVIRVGDDYWMVASSFTCMPGIPLLHSHDLVNWKIVNHIYDRLPLQKYDHPVHGQGSWAPSIRHHEGMFYVYFCTPHDGLFVARATDPLGKWDLKHIVDVENGKTRVLFGMKTVKPIWYIVFTAAALLLFIKCHGMACNCSTMAK